MKVEPINYMRVDNHTINALGFALAIRYPFDVLANALDKIHFLEDGSYGI